MGGRHRLRRATHHNLLHGGAKIETYADRVLGVEPANLIAYWPMSEAAGTNSDNLEGTVARDGTYTGVTLGQAGIGDGRTCPLFDGANDFCTIHSASLNTAFDGAEGTVAIWGKVSGAGVWTDGIERYYLNMYVGGDHGLYIKKKTTSNELLLRYEAGAVVQSRELTVTATGWLHLAFTWSKTADEVKFYYNGVQSGSTQTGLGVWVGDLSSIRTTIGAARTDATAVFDGYLAHCAVWTISLSAAQILALATV